MPLPASQTAASSHTPAIDGEFWRIGSNPDLGALGDPAQQVVDHAIFRSDDGRWHLWACVRGTAIGRLLYAWESDDITRPHWEPHGIAMRAEAAYGESINDWSGEEWIQAPHVVQAEGRHWMFFGGHNTERGVCQICLATSPDGRSFTRHSNAQGYSRVFVGPGEARDPMVLRVGDLYHCYYTGHDAGRRTPCKVYCRTSPDLLNWSEPCQVSWGGHSSGAHRWSAECPFVVHLDGYYYLFRTSEYGPPARTHVYRSTDPLDFGLGTDAKWVATLRVAAPEVIQVGDQFYISTVEDLAGGVQLARLTWL
ncbi:MAG: glycoside hydrolase family protein [Anaerolineae bacterium]